jgi:hypothetical protein
VCGLVEIGGEDTENGIFRQDGRINRSQEGNAEVRYRIPPWRDGLRAVLHLQAPPASIKIICGYVYQFLKESEHCPPVLRNDELLSVPPKKLAIA